MIVCVKEHKKTNIGDRYANPFTYFPYEHVAVTPAMTASHNSVQQVLTMQRSGAHVVLGGGGLFYEPWLPWMQILFENKSNAAGAGKLIVWGTGLNLHGKQPGGLPSWLDRADLVGMRDWNVGAPWAGCPSCMAPEFDTKYTPSREVVIYDHAGATEWTDRSWLDADGIPRMSNFHKGTLADVLAFMGSAEVVLTMSYHGAYWATLLGRKVIVLPFSSKFHHYRHQPLLCEDGNWRSVLHKAVNYPDALEECRAATKSFAARVVELLGPSPFDEATSSAVAGNGRPRIQLVDDDLGIGDILCMMNIAHSIKQALPNSLVHFVTEPYAMDWAKLDDVFDDVIGIPRDPDDPLRPPLAQHERLPRGGTYDAVIDMRCKGYSYEQGSKQYRLDVLRSRVEHVLNRCLKPHHLSLTVPAQARQAARRRLVELTGAIDRPIIGLQSHARKLLRRLSDTQLRGLVDGLAARNMSCCIFHSDVNAEPQISGAPIVAGSSPAELASLVAACDGLIVVDSGLFHLAAALSIPAVGAFGVTDGQLIGGLYPDCDWVNAGPKEREGLSCDGPCYLQAEAGRGPDCSYVCRALHRIVPDKLIDRLVRLLARQKRRSRTSRLGRPIRRIQIMREAGGIGDTVVIMQVASSIKAAKPDAEIALFVTAGVVPWTQLPWVNGMRRNGRLCNVIDAIMQVENDRRRNVNELPIVCRYKYMDTQGPYDTMIDLYDDESSVDGPVMQPRLSRWMSTAERALGQSLSLAPATILPSSEAGSQAVKWLGEHVGPAQHRPMIALQPLSHWSRRSLGLPAVTRLVAALRARCELQIVLLHHTSNVAEEWSKQLGVTPAVGLPPAVVVELLRRCDAVVAADSGMLHISGALSVPTVGLFGHTDGESICSSYPTCVPITAGIDEREGFGCKFPCYGRASFGYDNKACGGGCRALQHINMEHVADVVLSRLRIR